MRTATGAVLGLAVLGLPRAGAYVVPACGLARRAVPGRRTVLYSGKEPVELGGKEYYDGFMKSPLRETDEALAENRDNLTPSLKFAGGSVLFLVALVGGFFAANGGVPSAVGAEEPEALAAAVSAVTEPRGVTVRDSVVFAIGVIPFAWATVEFWTRIAVGLGFGTGKDSIVIDPEVDYTEGADEDQVRRFGGRRILGQDAILTARVLFLAAGLSLALTGFLAYEVITSG